MVLSQQMATLRAPGTLSKVGFARGEWYSPIDWLRSSAVVLSPEVATLHYYGTLVLHWLRSVSLVLSRVVATLRGNGTLLEDGSALWQCGTLSSYGYAP